MPPAIVAVAALAATYGVATSVTIAGVLGLTAMGAGMLFVGGLAGMAVSLIGNSLIQPNIPQLQLPESQFGRGLLLNAASTTAQIPVIYGSRRIGGARVFIQATGSDGEYLHLVFALGEGQISSIGEIYLNNIPVSDARFSGLVFVKRHLGADSQAADTDLITACSGWTYAHRLCGVAYIYVRLTWNQNAFSSGLPVVTADVNGRLLYDPRDGQTKFSKNPALAIRDYLTNTRYGRGIASASIDDGSIITAANYCDEIVSVGGVSKSRYACNGAVNIEDGAIPNLNRLLSSCRGMVVFSGGKYRLIIDKPEVAGFAFSEANITGSWTISLGNKRNMLNRVRVRIFSVHIGYQEEIIPVESSAMRVLDNGLVLETQIELPYTSDPQTAVQIARIGLNQSRRQIACRFTALIAGVRCEVGDVVTITHSTPGWINKKFRVLGMLLKNNDEVTVTAREYDDAVYDYGTLLESVPVPATNLPSLSQVAPPTGLQITEELYDTGMDLLSRAHLQWSAPADIFVVSYDVEYRIFTSSQWIRQLLVRGTTCQIDALYPGFYHFRIRATNTIGVSSIWTSSTSFVFGKTAPPANVASLWADAAQGGLRLSWTAVADIDLDYYRIKWSSDLALGSWSNSIEVGRAKTTTITIPAAKSGKYLVKAVDTSGNESDTAATVTTTIPTILAWNVMTTQVQEPAWNGVKTNMAVTGGRLVLDSALPFDNITDFDAISNFNFVDGVAASGSYEALPLDLGSVQTCRCFINLSFIVVNLDALFDAILDFDGITNFDGVDNENAAILPQIALSQDGATWGAWQNFIAGDYTARAFKILLACTSADARSYVDIGSASFTIDMPDRDESGRNISCPSEGLAITFARRFMVVPGVGIAAQGFQTGDYYEITSKTETGFNIIFKNSSGAGVARTIDWIARGY